MEPEKVFWPSYSLGSKKAGDERLRKTISICSSNCLKMLWTNTHFSDLGVHDTILKKSSQLIKTECFNTEAIIHHRLALRVQCLMDRLAQQIQIVLSI